MSKPVAKPVPLGPALAQRSPGSWTVGGWRLAEAPSVRADGAAVSRVGCDAEILVRRHRARHRADHAGRPRRLSRSRHSGWNNMAIPERLARQDYWYRTEIEVPAETVGKHLELNFKGVELRRRDLAQWRASEHDEGRLHLAASST
ncbi:hypothetical protein QP185_20495 [Sphingomonas aerolata]|uniref:hypothetical protein n=1 Tax=Sphingomonas aerolata TaxID=185951 RepID=UPI002FE3800C